VRLLRRLRAATGDEAARLLEAQRSPLGRCPWRLLAGACVGRAGVAPGPCSVAQAGARRRDLRPERRLGLGRVSCGIEEKTENDSVVSLCSGSHRNFGRKLRFSASCVAWASDGFLCLGSSFSKPIRLFESWKLKRTLLNLRKSGYVGSSKGQETKLPRLPAIFTAPATAE
jgi:hypothetical protein